MNTARTAAIELQDGDALIIVDVQNDFLPGGALAVPHGDEVVPALNRYIDLFLTKGMPIIATRDWHPVNHCSFQAQGGPWPPHCIANTPGATFAAGLKLPAEAIIISKAVALEKDAYSGFEGTELEAVLRSYGVRRLFIGGLATDYCVLNTVTDALENRYQVYVLSDAIRAVNVNPDDGPKAEQAMIDKGAITITLDQCS
ncbi:MAG: isochorismatase family protein [Gammaproteobacteria bacterium]